MNRHTALAVLALALVPGASTAAPCPLDPSTATRFPALAKAGGPVLFHSGLNVKDDGAPNAYHRVLGPTARDPATLHICNGVSVLELREGKMQNRYPQIGGRDLAASRKASADCKADVFELQEAGFRDCATGTCLRIVLPGGEAGEFARAYGVEQDDIALVAWKGRATFAAFADAGPKNKLGEGSPALINRLRGVADSTTRIGDAIASADPATTLLLPGSRTLHGGTLPADAAALYRSGMQALAQAGAAGRQRRVPSPAS